MVQTTRVLDADLPSSSPVHPQFSFFPGLHVVIPPPTLSTASAPAPRELVRHFALLRLPLIPLLGCQPCFRPPASLFALLSEVAKVPAYAVQAVSALSLSHVVPVGAFASPG